MTTLKVLLDLPSFAMPVEPRYDSTVIRGAFEKFVDWRKCAAVMQREAATVMPSCSGGVT
jgi:hypothetical protein